MVSTEECEIHPSGDVSPYVEARLWDDGDIPALALMCEKVNAHGALAAVELTHNGYTSSNLYSREVPLAPSHTAVEVRLSAAGPRDDPARHPELPPLAQGRGPARQARRLRHHLRVCRARSVVGDALPAASPQSAHRRLRRHAGEPRTAAARSAAGHQGCGRRYLRGGDCASPPKNCWARAACRMPRPRTSCTMLADLPDLWDVNVAAWYNDSLTSRFGAEGCAGAVHRSGSSRSPTSRWSASAASLRRTPWCALIREGVLDMIGAARPSIADPFLPRKIEEPAPSMTSANASAATSACPAT